MSSIPDLAEHFECPCCFEYILPPIWQCIRGHLICTSCKDKVSLCPTCQQKLDPISRNLTLEKISESLQFPCKYNCVKMLHIFEKILHEDECPLRPFNCPLDGLEKCRNWKGDKNEVINHLFSNHTVSQRIYKDGVELRTEIDRIKFTSSPNANGIFKVKVFVVNMGSEVFIMIVTYSFKNSGYSNFLTIQKIDTVEHSARYKYSVSLEGPDRKLSFEGRCNSLHENIAKIYKDKNCLTFDETTALKWINLVPSTNGEDERKIHKFTVKIVQI